MHLVILNGSPRAKAHSNTNLIIQAFAQGYIEQGNTVEVHHLSERPKWDSIREAFESNNNILMAVPLYVECIPGLMMEFLESLPPKLQTESEEKTKISFILQGGFSEASQLRCGERYLEQLPGFLNCDYGGTLIKGNMFVAHMLPEVASKKMLDPFITMGRKFAAEGCFSKEKVDAFAGPEYCSKAYILASTAMRPFHKLFFHVFFKKMGCQGSLRAKPYQHFLK